MAQGLARAGFDIDLADGQANENALAEILALTAGERIEVKTDYWAARTGNVAIEYRQHGRPSGISTTTAEWWALHLVSLGWFVVETERLKALARQAIRTGRHKRIGDGNNFDNALVPVEWLVRPFKVAA